MRKQPGTVQASPAGPTVPRGTSGAGRHAPVAVAEYLRAAMHTVPIALSLIDADLRYIEVNAFTAAITGKPVEAHPGRPLREVNPGLTDQMEALLRGVIATGVPRHNYRVSRPTDHAKGGTLELMMHVEPFFHSDGAVAGICVTATDITDVVRMQEKIIQAQRVEATGRLAASVAHDFNNLLTVVASRCDLMLLEMGLASPHREDVEEIRRAAMSATTLARRMLGTAHHRALEPKPLDLHLTVANARDLLTQASRTKASMVFDCAPDTGVVRADPTQLEQLLLNLVINAVDAMPHGGAIHVRTRSVELENAVITRAGELKPGPHAELSVSDVGVGMDLATQARIFEPFFTTKPEGQGTGLGLATVFGIVRDLGAGIDVSSAPGKGTTFRVLIPRLVSEERTGPRKARTKAAEALPSGRETVLLVEDEDALRRGVARLFSRHGYLVLEASHGGEALRVVTERDDVALVVSDLHMPGIGGRELASRLRSIGKTMPMLFLSGAVDGEAERASSLAGAAADRFIHKPVEAAALLTAVREMLDGA